MGLCNSLIAQVSINKKQFIDNSVLNTFPSNMNQIKLWINQMLNWQFKKRLSKLWYCFQKQGTIEYKDTVIKTLMFIF